MTIPGILHQTFPAAGQRLPQAARGVTLIELTVVVLILFVLGVFSVRALDPTPTARAQQLYSTASRMANGWMLLAASCGTSPDTTASPLPASGATPADVLTIGATSVNTGYANCYRAANVSPMDDVVRTASGQYTIGGLPFTVSGGGAAPFIATFNEVPVEVAARLAIQYAGSRVNLPLASSNQNDARVRWQVLPDGNYQVAILFHNEVTAAGTPSPWAPVAPASVSAAVVNGPSQVQLAALSVSGQSPSSPQPGSFGPSLNSPNPTSGGNTGGGTTAGTTSPCGGPGSSSTSPNSGSTSGNNLTTSGNGTTTGTNSNTTSAGNGTATGTGSNNNTTTSGNGSVGQIGNGCTSANTASPTGNGSANTTSLGSGSATGPNASTTTTSSGTSTTTTTNNGAGTGSTTSTASSIGSQSASAGGPSTSSTGGTSSPTSGNGSGGIGLSAGGGGTAAGGGNSTNSLPTCINGVCF